MSMCCCWIRPARSRWATGRPPNFIPAEGVKPEELADAAQLASLADETPEGRSIVVLAKEQVSICAGATFMNWARRSSRSPPRRA